MPISTIHDKVVAEIGSSSEKVHNAVVNHLVGKEVDRRVSAITDGLATLKQLEQELAKAKPDQNSFVADGTKVSETYSKAALEARQKIEKRINKLKTALELALDKADYGQLYSLNANKGASDEG